MQSFLFVCPVDVTQSSAAVSLNHWLECVHADADMPLLYLWISTHMHEHPKLSKM